LAPKRAWKGVMFKFRQSAGMEHRPDTFKNRAVEAFGDAVVLRSVMHST
jgi:hypothetical protein